MKSLTLKLNDKIYTSVMIGPFLIEGALKIYQDVRNLQAKIFEDTKGRKREAADAEMLAEAYDITDRKIRLICEAYGNQFTPDELERSLTDYEIGVEISKIINCASGLNNRHTHISPGRGNPWRNN